MTRNVYGVEAIIEWDVLDGWEWADYQPADVIKAISIQAAKTVLGVIEDNGFILVRSDTDGCFVRVNLGNEMGALSIPFAELIDDWLRDEGSDEDARGPMITALEDALAKVKTIA